MASSGLVAAAAVATLAVAGCDAEDVESSLSPEPPAAAEVLDVAEVPEAAPETTEPATVPSEPSETPEAAAPAPAKLTIGDPAPDLQLASYVVGTPVESKLGGGVHVVEFWATWCGPCRVSMPHISELQNEYGDEVTFIGVTREDQSTVEGFLAQQAPDERPWSEVITYRLAIDSNDATNDAYMRAAGQNGIPCAFIVGREGLVEWIGHPARIDEPLRSVVDGTWDRSAVLREREQQQRLRQLSRDLRQWSEYGQWDLALGAIDEVEKATGPSVGLMRSRLSILERAGRQDEAAQLRAEIVDEAWDNPSLLNEIAWEIAISNEPSDLQLAKKAAERASELRDHQDAPILDTVARVYYELGQLDEAIEWQRKAVEKGQGQHREIDQALERYLSEQEAKEAKPAS